MIVDNVSFYNNHDDIKLRGFSFSLTSFLFVIILIFECLLVQLVIIKWAESTKPILAATIAVFILTYIDHESYHSALCAISRNDLVTCMSQRQNNNCTE